MPINTPKPVLLSLTMLLVTHAVGLWHMVLLSHTLGVPLWMPYSALVIVYSLLAFLLAMILLGKYWARAAYTTLGALSLLATLGRAGDVDALGWLMAAFKVVALVLLFIPVSNLWFTSGGRRTSLEPTSPRSSA